MTQPVAARRYGRVTVDERGVRKTPVLFFFGSPFDLRWEDITGWATFETILDGGRPTPVNHSLELYTAGTIHFCSGVGLRFAALIEEVCKRLPDRRVESLMIAMQQARGDV